jgi:hypothetical protein
MSTQKNDDYGKISLWLNDGEGSALAAGKIQIFEQDGSITTLNVYVYENTKKANDKSPDYYGFIKQPQKKGMSKAPTKKGFTRDYQHGDIDEDDTTAF